MPTPDWLKIKLFGTILAKYNLFKTLQGNDLYFLNIHYQAITIFRIFKVTEKLLTNTYCYLKGN